MATVGTVGTSQEPPLQPSHSLSRALPRAVNSLPVESRSTESRSAESRHPNDTAALLLAAPLFPPAEAQTPPAADGYAALLLAHTPARTTPAYTPAQTPPTVDGCAALLLAQTPAHTPPAVNGCATPSCASAVGTNAGCRFSPSGAQTVYTAGGGQPTEFTAAAINARNSHTDDPAAAASPLVAVPIGRAAAMTTPVPLTATEAPPLRRASTCAFVARIPAQPERSDNRESCAEPAATQQRDEGAKLGNRAAEAEQRREEGAELGSRAAGAEQRRDEGAKLGSRAAEADQQRDEGAKLGSRAAAAEQRRESSIPPFPEVEQSSGSRAAARATMTEQRQLPVASQPPPPYVQPAHASRTPKQTPHLHTDIHMDLYTPVRTPAHTPVHTPAHTLVRTPVHAPTSAPPLQRESYDAFVTLSHALSGPSSASTQGKQQGYKPLSVRWRQAHAKFADTAAAGSVSVGRWSAAAGRALRSMARMSRGSESTSCDSSRRSRHASSGHAGAPAV